MAIEKWSDEIFLVNLGEEPQLSEDLAGVAERVDTRRRHVVLNAANIRHINSSNIAQLLRLRKKLNTAGRDLVLCSVPDAVWSIIISTSLDGLFHFAEDVPSALAALQLDR